MTSSKPTQALEIGRGTVTLAEERVVARRERVKALTAAIRRKSHTRFASAGMLIGAFGAGVALEQIKRRHAWWLVSLLGAANTLEQLVGMAASLVRPTESSASSAARPETSDPQD